MPFSFLSSIKVLGIMMSKTLTLIIRESNTYEGANIRIREVIRARRNRCHTCRLKSRGEELNMRLLIEADVLEVVIVSS